MKTRTVGETEAVKALEQYTSSAHPDHIAQTTAIQAAPLTSTATRNRC